ncbi:MAG TPA: hypothetical protein VFA28_13715 [Bryobacteraceae bacterium]|jgi:hypothetical protein|nr:hypothetical protein [Bryobacteraceae bacterium]
MISVKPKMISARQGMALANDFAAVFFFADAALNFAIRQAFK